jgi:hypothetical protein
MIVNKVEIKISGRHNLDKLTELHYQPIRTKRVLHYIFDGQMHRYDFREILLSHQIGVLITITAKNKDTKLIHFITFEQIRDWVGQSVDKIQIGGIRRKTNHV